MSNYQNRLNSSPSKPKQSSKKRSTARSGWMSSGNHSASLYSPSASKRRPANSALSVNALCGVDGWMDGSIEYVVS